MFENKQTWFLLLIVALLVKCSTPFKDSSTPKQFLLSKPPLRLVESLFNEKNDKIDPRKSMVDDVKELDGVKENPNDPPILSPRMKQLQRVLLHVKTPEEKANDLRNNRVKADQNEMSSRLRAWRSSHLNRNKRKNEKYYGINSETTASHGNSKNNNRGESDSATHSPRFTRTSSEVSAITKADSGGKDQYIATQEPQSAKQVHNGMSPDEKKSLMKAIEEQVDNSEKLQNFEKVEHTGGEDPENKKSGIGKGNDSEIDEGIDGEAAGGEGGESATEDLDGPENGGGGEETPIYKWYKWWDIKNWDQRALESMVNSPTHGQLNQDIGGKASSENTHGDDAFMAQMADASSGVVAVEGEGTGHDKEEDGAVKCKDCKPFPAWTRKDNWIRTDANFAQDGIVPPTETDQKELADAIEKNLPQTDQLNDASDPARLDQLKSGANVGAGPVQDSLRDAMNIGVEV
jgi:hypothetical protein